MQAIENPHRADEQVSQAMTMLGVGHSATSVSRATGIPATTLRDWARSPELVAKYADAIKTTRERVAYRAGQILEDAMDRVEDGTDKLTAPQAAVVWGIATDKVQKDSTPSRSGSFVRIMTSDGTVIEAGSSG